MTFKPSPQISAQKKILFYFLIALFLLIALELCSYIFLKINFNNYSLSNFSVERNNILSDIETEIINDPSLMVSHPYLGYVYNPDANNELRISRHGGIPISEYGFVDTDTPFYDENDDTIVLGIFGGSVAYWFSVNGIDSLIDSLGNSPFFRNKKISIVRVALGGYKQPQQLIALPYLLSLGAHFDIIINLDGFNEVALPPVDNLPNNVYPFFPRNWHWQAMQTLDHKTKSLIGTITYLRNERKKYASIFNVSLIRYSNFSNLIWKGVNHYLVREIAKEQVNLHSMQQEGTSDYERSGPSYKYDSERELYDDLANTWKESSMQMEKICKSNGILYFHFLQPNQYVTGAKRLTKEEKKLAFNKSSPFKRPVEIGYPILQKEGRELALSGVNFHDLTNIFKDVSSTLYTDDCCHFNETGNEILGEMIGNHIVQDIEREK